MKAVRRFYLWIADHTYGKLARFYDPLLRLLSLDRLTDWRLAALHHLSGQKVLEIGFGTGALLLETARRGVRVYGLERSAQMIQVARTKLIRNGVHAHCVRAKVEQMPFADGSFDSVLATFPAGFIFDPATLSEAARVLRAAGIPHRPSGRKAHRGGLGYSDGIPCLAQGSQAIFGSARGRVDRSIQRSGRAGRLHGPGEAIGKQTLEPAHPHSEKK